MNNILTTYLPASLFVVIILCSLACYSRINKRAEMITSKRTSLDKRMPSLKLLYSLMYLSILIIGCLSFGNYFPAPIDIHNTLALEYGGLSIAVLSFLFFLWSVKHLGENYAPNYDSREPISIVGTGPYRYIKHPMYTANVTAMLAMSVATGNSVVLFLAVVLGITYYRSAKIENMKLHSNSEA